MKKFATLLFIISLIFSCQTEKLDLDQQEANASELSLHSNSNDILRQCKVIDLDRCDLPGFTTNFWWPEGETNWEQGLFHQDDDNKLTFTEYNDGTASILGSTVLGTCVVTVDVWLKDKKTWDVFTNAQNGGSWKDENNDCTDVDPTILNYYQIDSSKSTITASSDCAYGAGETFGVEQRPDPLNGTDGDPSTIRLGAPVGPGAGLFDAANKDLDGLSTWGWLTKNGIRQYIIDFNFNFECEPIVEECFECDGKVTELVLQYNGNAAADIVVETKKEGLNNNKVVFEGNVQPGGIFSISGNDKKGTLGTEITIRVDGNKNTEIHTSCSEAIGPGLISGDFLVISGASRNGGNLCPVDTPPSGGDDCSECKGKVTKLELQYNGTSSGSIEVVQKKDDIVAYSGTINPGETFMFTGKDDKGTLGTEITIYIDGVDAQSIHTSCSESIGAGAVFGDFTVIGGTSREGGELCPVETPPGGGDDCGECEGKVTRLDLQYNGTSSGSIEVVQKKDNIVAHSGNINPGETFMFTGKDDKGTLGTEISIYVNGSKVQSIHTSCSETIGAGAIFGDFTVIGGTSREGGELCPVETPPGGGDDCGECEGKVTRLDLQYNGNQSGSIVVETKKEGTVFQGNVNPGETFTIYGNDKKGTLGTEITISVNGKEKAKVHTSCSKPIGPGAVFGDFTVIGGASRNGGELCPANTPPTSTECICKGKIVEMIVEYSGPNGADITVADKDGNNSQTFNNVQTGDILPGNIGNVGNWWHWSVNGNVEARIHTSCSDDILGNDEATKSTFGNLGTAPDPVENDNNGTFLVVSHTDENGNICSILMGG